MKLLLDTNTVIWWLGNSPQLSPEARREISNPEARVCISIATAWEIAIKRSIGKLETPGDLAYQIEAHGFELLAISLAQTEESASLPLYHRDPFDRMIVAQALVEDLTIVTRDRHIARYGVPILPA